MKQGKVGVQMMMMKEEVAQNGVYETMRKLKEIGYNTVEISQIPMTEENVSEFKRACEDFEMEVAAMSAFVEPVAEGLIGDSLANDFDKIVADCKALNCNYLRIGMIPIDIMGDLDKVMDFIRKAEAQAVKLAEYGIDLYHHTHHIEFEKIDGKYLLDIIKDNTEKLGFELDVHWIQRAGENPVEIIKAYKDRVALLHLKDYRIGRLYLTEEERADYDKYMRKFVDVIEYAEVGEGNLNIKAIIEAGLEGGAEYFIVEQDDTYGVDPFESLKISAKNLKKMGYEHWFADIKADASVRG